MDQSIMSVYGVNTNDHQKNLHGDNVERLFSSLFLDGENWIFDFMDKCANDSKRTEELKRLRLSLIPFLFSKILDMIENCQWKDLQYQQM